MIKDAFISRDVPFISQASLVVSNLVLLIGVWFFGWELYTLLVIYWAESGVIGFYTILRIANSEKGNVGGLIKTFLSVFFIFHFGGFMLGHGIFLGAFFATGKFTSFSLTSVLIALVFLFISHGISFYKNFIEGGEYKKISPNRLMGMPYKRIIVMHLVIIIAGFSFTLLDNFRIAILLSMIILKTFFDLRSHIKEHENV